MFLSKRMEKGFRARARARFRKHKLESVVGRGEVELDLRDSFLLERPDVITLRKSSLFTLLSPKGLR